MKDTAEVGTKMSTGGEETRAREHGCSRVSRRGFLRGVGALGGALALATVADTKKALANEDFPGNPDRFGMLTDMTKCMGCRMCETACAGANKLPAPPTDPAVFETRRHPSPTALTVVNRFTDPDTQKQVFRKEQCMHCDEPACASACLVGALKKTKQGPVVYNEELCIGCRYCMIACPFGRLSYTFDQPLTPKVMKCTMCYERATKDGGTPACASICPTKATVFGKRSDLLTEARTRILQAPDKYTNHVYGDSEVGGTGWMYLSPVSFDKVGFRMDLGKTPYPEFTRDFLLAVPLVLMMWPAALTGVNALVRRREKVLEEESKSGAKEEQR